MTDQASRLAAAQRHYARLFPDGCGCDTGIAECGCREVCYALADKDAQQRVIAWFSCGDASAVAAKLGVAKP